MSEVGVREDFLGVFGVLERDGALLLAGNRRRLAPGGEETLVWDLPGGRVEPGESLAEALVRELEEECRLDVECGPFLFVQEGVRYLGGERAYMWRSFFFVVASDAEPRPGGDITALLWVPRPRVAGVLAAPYHAGFVRWLADGQTLQRDEWRS